MRGIGSILQEAVEVELADGEQVRVTVRHLDAGTGWDVFEDGQLIGNVKRHQNRRPPVSWEAKNVAGDRLDGVGSRRQAVRLVVQHARDTRTPEEKP